jgi:hypothetical protein
MSRQNFSAMRWFTTMLVFLLLAAMSVRAAEKDLKLEALLVLASNDPKATGTPVSPEIEKKLKQLPFKWDKYFVLNSQQFSLANNAPKAVSLSATCQILVNNLGSQRIKLEVFGSGKSLGKITQSLKKGHLLVIGANVENTLVVLRQMD